MSDVRSRIEKIMNDSGNDRFLSPGYFLFIASIGYGIAVRMRARLYQKNIWIKKRLPCPVVSIGNLTLGGTGKTPATIYLSRLLNRHGRRVVILTRGYKGKAQRRGGMVSDGKNILMGLNQTGDEPLMMAERLPGVPIFVGANRFASGMLAISRFHPDVILLDDAFQHMGIFRDLDLVLLDSRRPFGNGCLFPRGTLREPVSSIRRADALIFTRCDEKSPVFSDPVRKWIGDRPVFQASHTPFISAVVHPHGFISKKDATLDSLREYQGKKIVAFSGIAQNMDFYNTLQRLGCKIIKFFGFKDHHPYSNDDLAAVARAATKRSAEFIFTTEKDYSRIHDRGAWPIHLVVVGVTLRFQDEDFDKFITTRLDGITAIR